MRERILGFVRKVKEWFNGKRNWFKLKYYNFKKWFSTLTDEIEYVKELVLYVLIYGLFLNYALFVIWGVPLKLHTFPAWGVIFYFIKEEFPQIVQRCKR